MKKIIIVKRASLHDARIALQAASDSLKLSCSDIARVIERDKRKKNHQQIAYAFSVKY